MQYAGVAALMSSDIPYAVTVTKERCIECFKTCLHQE